MLLTIGIVLILLAIAIRYWIGRRNFYRRNQFGAQTFRSYEHAIGTRLFENFMHFIVVLFIIVGILLIIAYLTYDPNMTDFKRHR